MVSYPKHGLKYACLSSSGFKSEVSYVGVLYDGCLMSGIFPSLKHSLLDVCEFDKKVS